MSIRYKIYIPNCNIVEVKIVPGSYFFALLALNKEAPLQYTSMLLVIIELPELSFFTKDRELLGIFFFSAILKYFCQTPAVKKILFPSLNFNFLRTFTVIMEHTQNWTWLYLQHKMKTEKLKNKVFWFQL